MAFLKLNLLSRKLMGSLLSATILMSLAVDPVLADTPRPPWAKEFYGPVTFRLVDDPVYAEKQNILGALLTELNTTKALHQSKVQSLEQKNKAKTQKIAELDQTKKSLEEKNDKLEKNIAEIQTDTALITSYDNAIAAATSNIRVKENELITLNNTLNPLKDQFAEATAAKNEKQAAYDAALAACQQSGNTACSDESTVIVAKHHLDRAKERLQYLGEQVAHFDQLVRDAQTSIANSQSTIATSRTEKEQKQARIQTLTTENTKLREEIPVLITKVGDLTRDLDKLTAEVTTLSQDVTRIGNIVTQQEVGYANEQNLFKRLEDQLIEDVLSANRMGYAKSRSDGQRDGIEVARVVGDELGERNGKAEGESRGSVDGRAREYARGKEQGEKEGAIKGREDGLAQGEQRGREEGHQLAGAKEGEAAGLARAESSDAAQVGRRLGLQEGVQRARVEGERRGRGAGEAEAIQQMENRQIRNEVIRGPFAGTFANKLNLPAFPGARGTYRNDESGHSRRIIRLAYIAGYSVGYDRAAEEVYYANIESIYTESYNRFYQTTYQAAVNRAYPEAFRQGKDEQFRKAWQREFDIYYRQTFEASRADALARPDRNSAVFKNAYKAKETATFEARYLQIRNSSLEAAARETFNQNIAAETEKARQRRLQEVNEIYQRFAVVKFQSANITDIGNELVGINDNVYMPGESIAHNVTITNYSDVAAKGLTLTNAQGEKFVLEDVPARATVTVLGAGKSVLDANARLGKAYNITAGLKMDLTSSETQIQGRHFESAAQNLLKGQITSQVTAQLPVQVTGLTLSNPLILNHPSQVVTQLQNISSRTISGPITINLDSSAGRTIFTQTYANLDTLAAQATLNQAEVLINRPEMIFQELDFSLALYKNGVLLGRISNVARDYVKAPYVERSGRPVVVLNSTGRFSREFFKDIAGDLGGIDQVSILDLAGGAFHQNILERQLAGKTVYVINDRSNSLVALLDKALNTKNLMFAFVSNETNRGALDEAQGRLEHLANATKIPFDLDGQVVQIVSSSPEVVTDLSVTTSLIEVDIQNLEVVSKLENLLKLTNDELLSEIARKVTADGYFSANSETKMLLKVAGLRNLEEAETLADVYDRSLGARHFLFFKLRDKSYLKRVKEDANLFVNKMKAKLDSAPQNEKLAVALAAYAVQNASEEALNGEFGFSKAIRKMRKAYEKSFDGLLDKAEKVLKSQLKNIKKPHKKAAEQANLFRPFPAR
ncbi:MAG: hypothetical protein HYV97_10180 [Bdellovibrio sp.]|nr:hypothetical protein [Bdellovibrio sp.]